MKMKKIIPRAAALFLALLAAASLIPICATAAGPIDPEANATLNIEYHDGSEPIPGCTFNLYRVADVDRYAELTLCGGFEKYRDEIEFGKDAETWDGLASTLKVYALSDKIAPEKSGTTNGSGFLCLGTDIRPGLFMVEGSAVKIGHVSYSPVPFMVFLPAADPLANEWVYQATVTPKKEKETVTRELKVLKIWDDKGYETIRPESVTVQLYCDGEPSGDPVTLNRENNWRYLWDDLPVGHSWFVREEVPEGYKVKISTVGETVTVTNKYYPPVIGVNPPVQKKFMGDIPPVASNFFFMMTAKDPSCPMPEGSIGTKKTVMVSGASSTEFGNISFEKPGVYTYYISEVNNGVLGYTYDTQIYTLTFTVDEDENGRLRVAETRLVSGNGLPATSAVFVNIYRIPGNRLPQTGQLWWPVPVLTLLGAAFLAAGLAYRRRESK